MENISDKNKLLHNFSRCRNWEEKYLYIIELGSYLPPLPVGKRTADHLIDGCQSRVWIAMTIDNNNYVQLYGDSDTIIVKGLIAVVFILYHGMTLTEIINYDVRPFFNKLALIQHLTPSRTQGIEAIVRGIRTQAAIHL